MKESEDMTRHELPMDINDVHDFLGRHRGDMPLRVRCLPDEKGTGLVVYLWVDVGDESPERVVRLDADDLATPAISMSRLHQALEELRQAVWALEEVRRTHRQLRAANFLEDCVGQLNAGHLYINNGQVWSTSGTVLREWRPVIRDGFLVLDMYGGIAKTPIKLQWIRQENKE